MEYVGLCLSLRDLFELTYYNSSPWLLCCVHSESSLLIHKHARHASALKALHLMFSLPELFLLLVTMWITPLTHARLYSNITFSVMPPHCTSIKIITT